jgi:predicted metalloprotease with PDZ domain
MAFRTALRLLSSYTLAAAFAALPVAARAQSQPIVLVVDASATPITGIVHVHETVPVSAASIALAYPRWVPGEHGPEGPVQNVGGLTVTAGAQTLAWSRDLADLNEFHITVPAGVTSIDVDFDYLGSKDGTYGEARLATSAILAINWNQFLLYPQNADIATTTFVPAIVLPGADWTAETALPGPSRAGNKVTYAPATLERLVDSPLDAGTAFKRFTLLDADGFTNEIDAFADRPAELDLDPKKLDGFKAVVGEMDAIYGARHWKNYHFLLTLSDEMPGNGVEHGSSSDDGTGGDGLTDADGVIGTAGLLSHEFNHSWDGKYRRPADLATNNFQVPERTELLWIYEGMTQFYGDLVPARAGLWKPDFYRDVLAGSYASEDHEPGRLVRPLIDTAADAPVLYSAPRSYGGERRGAGDFYVEGELLWLDVYGKLLDLSGGTKSLDGFCRTFFGIKNTPAMVNPYTYEEFVAALNAYQPYDWDAYFKSKVYAVTAHPPDPFERLGWKLVYTDKLNSAEAARQKRRRGLDATYSLGISGGDKGTISDVKTDSPAAKAGLGVGDTLVAVDAREFSPDVLDEELGVAKKSSAPLTFIVKRDGLFRTVSVDYHGGVLHPHLVRIDGVPDRLTPIEAAHRANAPAPAK